MVALPALGLAACSSRSSSAVRPATSPVAPTTSLAQAPVAVESNPPGDIPDNLAFVTFHDPGGRFSFSHPEGWVQSDTAGGVQFSDKLNGVTVTSGAGSAVPTVASARTRDVPALAAAQQAFTLTSVSAVTKPGGMGVLIVYRRNSSADPVTGRQYRDEVQRYELASGGREVVMELFGPVGADNVDAYATMIRSVKLA